MATPATPENERRAVRKRSFTRPDCRSHRAPSIGAGRGGRPPPPDGELEREDRAAPQLAVDVDPPAVRLGELARQIEPDAEAAIRSDRAGPLEALEDARLIL